MSTTAELLGGEQPPKLSDDEVKMARAAQRCIMAALDYSKAPSVVLVNEDSPDGEPVIKLPPVALRLMAQVLGLMGEGRPIVLMPTRHEMTTNDVANFLNVSRPFVIKEVEAGRLAHRKVGTHRRIAYEDAVAYKARMVAGQRAALQELADDAQELGLGY